jgi:putative FmdB family regulatory protein
VPTYQYACTSCGEPLEAVQSFSDDALTECPGCGGNLRKVFSAVGIVFKGSGFYRTDSRSDKTSTIPSAQKDSSSTPATTSSSSDSSSSSTSKTAPATSVPASSSASTTAKAATSS